MNISVFDIASVSTKTVSAGHLAPALRASASYPGLFTPVKHSRGILIDGAIGDPLGVFCLPPTAIGQVESSPFVCVLNVTLDDAVDIVPPICPPPLQHEGMNYVRLALSGLPPRPHPFAMERGSTAIKTAYRLVKQILDQPMVQCAFSPTCYYSVTGM